MTRARLLAFAPLLLVALVAYAFWPGILTWDAIRQYKQALGGQYDDWHPPAMNWLWRQLHVFGAGPAPMMLLQAGLYGGGFSLLVDWAARRRAWAVGGGLALLAAMPITLVLVATVLKDSLMAGALLAATGCILRRPGGRLVSGAVAAMLLLGAATLRFNAVPACLPLALMLAPARWTRTRARLALTAALVTLPLVAALPVANALLQARRSGVELSLVVYDLAGITRFSGADVFPPQDVADPVKVVTDCYSPVSWDRYAWWGAEPCAVGFQTVRPALAAAHQSGTGLWARAILHHPVGYAKHRLLHFSRNTRLLGRDGDTPTLSLRSDPNPWGYQVGASAAGGLLGAGAAWSVATPLGWPAVWLALGLGVLVGLAPRGPALPILASGLLYGFSYLPLSVASEVRYHLWTMLAVGIGTILALHEVGTASGRRLALAFAPGALAIALAVAART